MDIFTVAGQGYDSNIFVILGKMPTVIDTGTGLNGDAVLGVLKRFVDPGLIKQIVLTHEHYDHVGGVVALAKECAADVRVCGHPETVVKLREGESEFAHMLGGSMPRITVDTELVEGMKLLVGDTECVVMETPGHSQGSICLFDASEDVLVSGDTVFAHGDFGRYDLAGGDYELLKKSINRLAGLSVERLYPGHGPIVEEDAGRHLEKAQYNVAAFH